jgi:hypothetical protein
MVVGITAVFDLSVRHLIGPTAISGLLALAVEVFLVGFVGAQRVWLYRTLSGSPFGSGEAWTLPWRFFGRFVCLGLLAALTLLPLLIPISIAENHHRSVSTTPVHLSPWWTVGVVVWSFLIDVALTFVVPALALNVRSVHDAIRLGWRMSRRTWPTNGWYMFAPGVTVVAFAAVLPRSLASGGVYVLVGLVSSVISLWFKGAIVAFYIRSITPASTDGSAAS